MSDRQPIVYRPGEMPDVEVLYEGTWCPGEVRMVSWPGGVETHHVQYRRPGDLSSHLDAFPADQVRKDAVDRSAGRE
jgi:hypothetical protein